MPACVQEGAQITIFGRDPIVISVRDPLQRGDQAEGGDVIAAPMPGLVQAVAVGPGDVVASGDRVVVLEAMKMEHVLRAPRDGVVAKMSVAVGDQVAAGDILTALEPL